jgi:hypothetical protein
MPIVAGDIAFKYSIKTGSAGNTTASAGATSLGKYISTSTFDTAPFADVPAADNTASTPDYECYFLLNNHATLTLKAAGVYISSEVAGGTAISIATDNVAASAKGSSSAQADQISTRLNAPTAVSAFSSPTTAATALSLGDIPAGSCRAFWAKRTPANTAATADGVTFGFTGETDA